MTNRPTDAIQHRAQEAPLRLWTAALVARLPRHDLAGQGDALVTDVDLWPRNELGDIRLDRAHTIKRLVRKLEDLGCEVELTKAA